MTAEWTGLEEGRRGRSDREPRRRIISADTFHSGEEAKDGNPQDEEDDEGDGPLRVRCNGLVRDTAADMEGNDQDREERLALRGSMS